jgi:hypothetical protein
MKMASSRGDNTTQGNASLICIGDHSSGKMLASMQHAQGPEAHKPANFCLKPTCSKARNCASVGPSKSYLCRAHQRLRELLHKTAHEPATDEAKGSGWLAAALVLHGRVHVSL